MSEAAKIVMDIDKKIVFSFDRNNKGGLLPRGSSSSNCANQIVEC